MVLKGPPQDRDVHLPQAPPRMMLILALVVVGSRFEGHCEDCERVKPPIARKLLVGYVEEM